VGEKIDSPRLDADIGEAVEKVVLTIDPRRGGRISSKKRTGPSNILVSIQKTSACFSLHAGNMAAAGRRRSH